MRLSSTWNAGLVSLLVALVALSTICSNVDASGKCKAGPQIRNCQDKGLSCCCENRKAPAAINSHLFPTKNKHGGGGGSKDACVDLRSNPGYCGSCTTVCPGIDGHGTSSICCNGTCTDSIAISSDTANCGACGHACPAGQLCCSGNCVSTDSDPANCGACDRACAEGEACCNGVCTAIASDRANCGGCDRACAEGEDCCSGGCTAIASDPANCGGCGAVCNPPAVCCNGQCVLDDGSSACGACNSTCTARSETCCGGQCADLLTDVRNCGACGSVCGNRAFDPDLFECCGGQTCSFLFEDGDNVNCLGCGNRCQQGLRCCFPDGCVDTRTDTRNCGICQIDCRGGLCCGGNCVDQRFDNDNCGDCGTSCLDGTCVANP